MKTQYIKTIGSTLIVGAFLFLAFGSDDSSDTPEEKKENALKGVSFSGRTANITYEIEDGTWTAQMIHEAIILDKIYYIIVENKADKINITMTDYCQDSYGHNEKRYWHKKIDKSWSYWGEASKYSDSDAFSNKLGKYYLLSSNTEEGTFYCCGRDRGCN
jgi:hypothetical protein